MNKELTATDQNKAKAQITTNEEQTTPKKRFLLSRICEIVCAAVQLLLIVFFLAGAARITGESANIVSIFSAIIGIFRINKAAWYRTIVRFGAGLAYIVILVFLIRNFIIITSVKYLKNFRNDDEKTRKHNLSYIAYETISTFELIFLYIAITNLLWENSLSGLAIASLVVGASALVFSKITACCMRNPRPAVSSFRRAERGVNPVYEVRLSYKRRHEPLGE